MKIAQWVTKKYRYYGKLDFCCLKRCTKRKKNAEKSKLVILKFYSYIVLIE